MSKLCVFLLFVVILISGCSKSKGDSISSANGANADSVTESSETVETVETTVGEAETKDIWTMQFEIKGEPFIYKSSVIYTKEGDEIFAYVVYDDEIQEQPLETLNCQMDDGTDLPRKLYWFISGDAVTAISESENSSDTTYAIDEDTIILESEHGETEDIHKIDIKTAKTEKLQFDFGDANAQIVRAELSPDHTKGIVTLQSNSLDCIYYLVDFISMETKSLNELFSTPLYNADGGVETAKAYNIRFADDETIVAAVQTENSCQIIKYSFATSSETVMKTIDDCSGVEIVAGDAFTLVKYNDSELIAIDNDSFEVKEYDVRVNDSSVIYGIQENGYAVIESNMLQNQYVVSLETGEIVSDELNNNSTYMIMPDGSLFEYIIKDGYIVYDK